MPRKQDNDGNDTDSGVSSEDNFENNKVSRELLLKYIEQKDIRVIFYGNIHTDLHTQVPMSFLDDLGKNLSAIYLENVIPFGRPDVDLYVPSKKRAEKDEIKSDDKNSQENTGQEFLRESDIFREYLRDLEKNPMELESKEKILQFLVNNKLIDKAFAFGCHDHKHTRESLMAVIAGLGKGQLILINIGMGHLFRPIDAADYDSPKLMRSKTGNLAVNAADLEEVSKNDSGAATIYADDCSKGKIFANSLSLVDYFSSIDQFSILTIIGGWYEGPLVLDPKAAEEKTIDVNLAAGKLMQRQQQHPNMLIAKNYLDWDKPYFIDMLNGGNKYHFDQFQAYLRDYLTVETYSRILNKFSDWDVEFRKQSTVTDPVSLFFAPLSYLMPGAKSPAALKKQIENFKPRYPDVSDDSDINDDYQDFGSDFDK